MKSMEQPPAKPIRKGPGKLLKGLMLGAALATGGAMAGEAHAEHRSHMSEAKKESGDKTKWGMHLVEQAAADLNQLKSSRDVDAWAGAYPEQLTNQYFMSLNEKNYTAEDCRKLLTSTQEMTKMMGALEKKFHRKYGPQEQNLNRMSVSLQDKLSSAEHGGMVASK